MALAEATAPGIATFTGHSLKDVKAVLDCHSLGREVKFAKAAIESATQEKNYKPRCKPLSV